MGSYGYVFDMNLEKYYRDFKIVQMWLGGAQRDRLDIAQGLYGPFKWAGYEDWLRAIWPKKFADLKNTIEKEIDKTLNRTSGSEKEAEKIRKELSRDMEYDIDEATKG